MSKFKIILILILCILPTFSINTFAEQKNPVASWKDIIIGKTTEEEIIATNPEGSVNLSVGKLLELTKGQNVLRVLEYGSERSYAEEKRKNDEFFAWACNLPEWNKDLADAFEFLDPKPKLEDYLRPALLNNGPIDLRWDKLGCAKLYIYSNGVVQSWVIKYWFFDPSDLESLEKRMKYLPTKDEVLEIFEIELSKPEKILKPDSQQDVYIFSLDKRKLELKLMYFPKPRVQYVEFGEKGLLLDEELIDLLSKLSEEIKKQEVK